MTAMVAMEQVGKAICQVGESPLWSAAEQALYWVDIEGRAIHRMQAAGHEHSIWKLPQRPACLALHARGGLVCALESSIVHLHLDPEQHLQQSVLAQLAHSQDGMRFNDGRCDRSGRFWVGSMLMDMSKAAAVGKLYRLDHSTPSDLSPHPLLVPNGLAFSPDGRTMYFSDSHPAVQCIWALPLAADGTPGVARLFVDMQQHPGRPDGAAVDVDGGYWICANDAGLVHRFTPEGVLDRSIRVPVSKPSMCSFGGAQMDELYITSIRPAQPPPGEEDLAGATFVCRPGAQGLAETPFSAASA